MIDIVFKNLEYVNNKNINFKFINQCHSLNILNSIKSSSEWHWLLTSKDDCWEILKCQSHFNIFNIFNTLRLRTFFLIKSF